MSAATKSSRRRMGLTTLIGAIFIVASLVWATYNFVIVQSGSVRQYNPHYPYDDIPSWPYDLNWAGGRATWFDYDNVPLDINLPPDLIDQWDQVMFMVGPADPPQLWRIGAYDYYNGSDWGKTIPGSQFLTSSELIPLGSAPNQVYTVALNVTAGAAVGAVELPTLFPYIRVIEDSFMTWSVDSNGDPYPDPGRLISYELRTDDYGTLLFSPFIQGETGEQVIVTYNLTFETQNMNNIVNNALPASTVVGMDEYLNYPSLTPEVEANITQFQSVGSNAYEQAMAVQLYFQSTFQIFLDLNDRPPAGQEVTDWFLERGGGLPMDFATAYCVFMRRLGIPSRLAMGYAVGDPDYALDVRTLRVRHMSFWSEVWIPLAGGGGEWIQVIPATLPPDMGGGEDPNNTPNPNVQLLVWPTSGQPWEQIGTPFELSAAILVDNVLVTTPETISFVDETDSVYLGTSITSPIANITYAFPTDATIDYHIFAATWTTSTLSITNRTSVFAVGTPSPFSGPAPPTEGRFILSDTTELNVSQGLDTYVAYWEDTVHVYGTMTVGGVPVNSSNYDNRNVGIYWDNAFMGNASIDEYGYYELDVYVDPLDLADMTVGTHEVWSWYLGDWDQYGIPRLNEARSGDNSTITVWGRVGFNLNVYPTAVTAGQSIDYDGVAYLLNGTTLPLGQQVGVFFHSQANTTLGVNSTGGFSWSYTIPVTQSDGTYFAYANWSSPWPLIEGNWSYYIPIDVGSSGTQLSIFPTWDPLYVALTITINGNLTHVSNGTGIVGRWIDIYWNNGSTYLLGSVLTGPNGYYELNYTILVGDEGPVEFWANFTSMEPTLASCESNHIFSNVKKWDVSLDPISITPDPVFILQPVDIQGNLSLPEIPYNLANEWVDFWLENSTGIFYIGSVMTNSTGGYFYPYTIPVGQATETVYIWANYTSLYINLYDGESLHEPLDIQATGTLISIQEDFNSYYVNETIFLYGTLQFSNGTPIQFETVYIHWVNASGTFLFQKKTDAFGDYWMFYNCSPTQDEPGFISVNVNWTSWTPIYDDAFSSIAPKIQLQRYDQEISLMVPTQLYVDELDFDVLGNLTYVGGTPPRPNELVYLYFWNGTGWVGPLASDLTNSSGEFLFPMSFLTYDTGDFTFGIYSPSSDLLHNDAATTFNITRIKYAINLDVTINPNPVMQNETLQIHVHAYFAHNGTDLSGEAVSLYWNNGTLPLPWLGNVVLDGTGQADFFYSGMDWDTVRTGIEVYGVYAGTVFFGSNESVHNILTLNQWLTTFTGVNLPVGPYRIGETVIVTGSLEYTIGSIPYGGATVELTLFGITRTTNVTASDGSFTLSWDIPGTISAGDYDLFVEFNSPFPWIADTSSPLPQITIIAPGYLWPAFDVVPTTVYLDQALTITGTVTWDNGTPYANSPIDIYWGDYSGANEVIVNDFLTDGSGDFVIVFDIPDDLSLLSYVQHVWAYIDPVGYATFGESPVIGVTVDIYHATIVTSVDLAVVYLGGSLNFSGTLQFTNGTPMVGYDLQIWWDGGLLNTVSITDSVSGAFSYVYPVTYSNSIGIVSGYALFAPPSIAWGTTDTIEPFNDVTVMERVDVDMDPEPNPNIVTRGSTLIINGDVFNDGGFAADGVTVEALVDGGFTGATDVTASDGSYSISLQVPTNQPRGSYIVSVTVTSTYHELRNGPVTWTIRVFVDSRLAVTTNLESKMPGESFNVDVALTADDGGSLDGQWVSLYLGTTYLTDVQLTDASGMRFQFTVPLSWSEGSGLYNITCEFGGISFVNPSTATSADSIHVFTDIVFSATPNRVDPGQSFILECSLRDPEGNPIMFRDVRLNYNQTDVYPYFIQEDGRFQHNQAALPDGSVINFRITLISTEVDNIVSGIFTINIQTTGGNPLQGTDLLIAGILLIGAVVAVLAYLYIVRGMFRSPVISRGIDIPTKLRNIKKLADSGKYGASITLAYRTFEQMCGTKMGSERTHAETAREYLDRVLQAIPLDSATVEQFVQTYEEARFSHHEMTRERYEEAVRIFTDLYPRIDSAAPVE
ncbi:MAG: transglutaminase domain-containing protein [Candidatus Thorarchaeota archaeon]